MLANKLKPGTLILQKVSSHDIFYYFICANSNDSIQYRSLYFINKEVFEGWVTNSKTHRYWDEWIQNATGVGHEFEYFVPKGKS